MKKYSLQSASNHRQVQMCVLRLCLLYSINDHHEKSTDLCVPGNHTQIPAPVGAASPWMCCGHYRALALVTHIYTHLHTAHHCCLSQSRSGEADSQWEMYPWAKESLNYQHQETDCNVI